MKKFLKYAVIFLATTSLCFAQGDQKVKIYQSVRTGAQSATGWTDDGTDVYLTTTSDSVGIGTTAPTDKLSVYNGRINIREMTSSDYAVLEFGNDSSSLVGGFFLAGSTAAGYGGARSMNLINLQRYPVALGSDNSVDMVIVSGGNVGIGTTAPNKNLQLQFSSSDAAVETGNGLGGGAAGSGFLIYNSNTTTNSYANLDFRSNNADARIAYRYTGTTNKGDFHFITDNTGSPQTKMVILDSGNVGIGTTAPNYKLEVDGTSDFGDTMTFGNGAQGQITWGASPTRFSILGKSGRGLGLGANGTENLIYIDTTGNVGIGTTDPGSYKLYVEGDTYIGGVTVTNGSLNFGGNLDMQNSIITNIGNAGTDFMASTGGLNLAGNLAVDTNVLYVDTSGDKVGIGTTAPGAKLDVNGTARVGTSSAESHLLFRRAGYNYVQAPSSGTLAFVTNGAVVNDGNSALVIKDSNDVRIGSTATTSGYIYLDDSADAVGIGTESPTSLLHIEGNYSGGSDNLIPQMKVINVSTTGGFSFIKTRMSTGYSGGYPELWMQSSGTTGGSNAFRGVSNHDLFFWTNNTQRMVIDKAGGIGIGTGSYLSTTPPTNGLIIDGNVGIGTATPGTAGLAVMNGNVGIGTTTPNNLLHVTGGTGEMDSLYISGSQTGNAPAGDYMRLYYYAGVGGRLYSYGSSAYKDMYLGDWNGGNPPLSLKVGGKLGIGAPYDNVPDALTVVGDGSFTGSITAETTGSIGTSLDVGTVLSIGVATADTALHIETADPVLTLESTSVYSTSPSATINSRFKHNTAGTIINFGKIVFAKNNNIDGNTGGYMSFWKKPAGAAAAEAMRIGPDGNVGIGTTAPATELEVVGTITGDVTGDLTGNASTVTNGIYTTSTWTGGELSGTGLAPTINDSVAVTSWRLTTPTITTSLTTDSKTISEAEIGRLDGLANTIVTDNNSCTDVEGKGLVITTGTLNWTAASTDLSDTANILLLDTGGTLTANVIANANLSIGNAATTAGVLTLLEDDDDGSNFASFMVPALTANTVYTLPTATGGAGEVLTDAAGNGTLSWAAGGGAEVNNLETVCTGIATTEIFVGNAANAGVYTALSGDVSMDNLGDVTVSTAAACSGESATVATITGLAPDTATTAAAQTAITSLGTLTGLSVGIGNTVPLTVLTTNNGRVGIGTTAPTTALQVVGTITGDVTGALTGQSDTVATITGLAPDTQNTYARTQYLIPYASTTTAFGQIAIGTDGQVLTSAGAGVAPAFETAAGVTTLQEAFDGGQTITIGDGDNQTLAITNNDVTNDPNTMTITNTGDKHGLYIAHTTTAQAVGYHGLYVQSTTANIAADAALIKIHQDNASSTEPALEIYNDGTGKALEIVNIGAGIGFFVEANTNFNEGACAAYIYDGNQEKTTGLGLLYVRANHASTSIPTIIINHKGSGVQIQGEGDENLSNAGVWTDRTSTFADKEVIDEIKGLEFIDKLRALKLYSYRKKSEIYGNKRRDEVEITEEEYDEENLSHSKKDKKFYKEIGEEKYPTVKKRPAARIFKGYILDDPTTPQELISRDLDGNMNGVSAADGVNFLLGVCKELINRIDELEARIEALE